MTGRDGSGWDEPFQGPERLLDLPADAPKPAIALLAFWDRVADGEVPDRASLTPFDLRPWLGYFSVYEHIPDAHDFAIRLEGTQISALTGEDWTGRNVSAVDARFGTTLLNDLTETLATGRPVLHRIAVFQKSWRIAIRLLLPARSRPSVPPDQIFMAMFAMDQSR